MALVWTCPPGNASVTTASRPGLGRTEQLGECSSGGQWIEQIELVESAQDFQISQLDPQIMAEAFGAGFIIMGTAWAIGRALRIILSLIGS